MQEKIKNKPKVLNEKKERRSDMKLIRIKVSEKEIYLWAACLCLIVLILTSFIFAGIIFN